jgi:osmotically-inducible protein OsmY
MISDFEVQMEVSEELRWEAAVDEADIAVAARDGVVTLAGTVPSHAERIVAAQVAARVAGVSAIANSLTVLLPREYHRADAELAAAAAHCLRWDVQLAGQDIAIRVVDGFVTLAGMVQSPYQRVAAERALANLIGLRGLTNLLAVRSAPMAPLGLATRIMDMIQRVVVRA